MSTVAEVKLSNGCTPKNALFCCHTPDVCLNGSPKILPIEYHQETSTADIIPINIPVVKRLGMIDVNISMKNSGGGESFDKPPATNTAITTTTIPTPATITNPQNAALNQQVTSTQPETRLGVVLRRTSPPKKRIDVKKSEPLMGVVLRKVEKPKLAPPKLRIPARSPPPKIQPPPTKSNKDPIPKAPVKQPDIILTPAPKPKPVNLLLNRPPPDVYKIEGDKIIIIRRIPRAKPAPPSSANPVPGGGAVRDGQESKDAGAKGRHGKHHNGKHRRIKGPTKIIQMQVTFCVL